MHLVRSLALAATLSLSLGAAGAAEPIQPLPDTSRLVVIGGSLTEIVFALGEEGRMVARDQTAVYPEAAAALPDVGYMRALSPEGVLSANPSALLIIEGSGPPEALEVIEKASVPYVEVPEGFSHDGILVKIRAVGAALGVPEKAEKLAQEVDAQLKHAQAMTANVTTRKRVLFILSMQGGKVMASGSNTAASGIIALAGAENAVSGYEGYKALTDEAIIEAKPDVILMMDREGGDHSALNDQLWTHPAIAMTPAAASKSILRFDGAYLLGFGPRTAGAVEELAKALYGDDIEAAH